MALAEFDPIRRRLQSQFQKTRQQSGDALQRRFASQGMLNSGAYTKTLAKQEAELAEKEAEALSTVDFQEAMEARRRQELEDQRKFQTSERLGSQQFSQGMFDKDFGLKEKAFGSSEEQRKLDNQFRAKEFDQNVVNNYFTNLANMDADFDDPQELNELINRLRGFGLKPPSGIMGR